MPLISPLDASTPGRTRKNKQRMDATAVYRPTTLKPGGTFMVKYDAIE